MKGLTPYQQVQMFHNVNKIMKMLESTGPLTQWVNLDEAEIIAGCKKRKLQTLVSEGKLNVRRNGRSNQYYRPDLEQISIQNSTLNK